METPQQLWVKNNPEKVKLSQKKYYLNHKQYYSNWQNNKTKKLRLEIIRLLGNKCANPFNINHGEFLENIECLQIDHVNGGGHKERRTHSWSYYGKILERIKAGSKDYQCLCANCNWIKKLRNGESNGKRGLNNE